MPDVLTTSDLIAHRKALQAAGTAIKLVMRIPAPLKPIADQVIRSARSVPPNQTGDLLVQQLLDKLLNPLPGQLLELIPHGP